LPVRTAAGLVLVLLGLGTLVAALGAAWAEVPWLGSMFALE
jgi:hypothetical protein